MKNNWAETWDLTLPSDLLYKSKWERQGSTVVDHVTILDISSGHLVGREVRPVRGRVRILVVEVSLPAGIWSGAHQHTTLASPFQSQT
ncbi:hypothetical protein ElyMa_004635700 [Elysia marginata]|uniref:Uncharacterized protein n=1 Tax=Elysia marginata TaxID=1093978 RepID=A0AAV4I4J9_9GAST|nr:hypothetical protein ElyMa_004635700 [Elysia marginata]